MARFDKYDPVSGGFRARLGWAPVASEVGDVIAVAINGSGLAVKTTDAITADGVVCMSRVLSQNDVIDVMTHGEIVDVGASDGITGAAAGATVYSATAGAIGTTAPGAGVNGTRIGKFVEAWRLIVRVQRWQG